MFTIKLNENFEHNNLNKDVKIENTNTIKQEIDSNEEINFSTDPFPLENEKDPLGLVEDSKIETDYQFVEGKTETTENELPFIALFPIKSEDTQNSEIERKIEIVEEKLEIIENETDLDNYKKIKQDTTSSHLTKHKKTYKKNMFGKSNALFEKVNNVKMNHKIYKRKIHQYSNEALTTALAAIRESGISIREASRIFNVPRGTIQDRLHGRVKEGPRKMGPCPILSSEEERKLCSWIIELAKCGFPRKKDDVMNTVQKLVTKSGVKSPFKENRPGIKWYYNFIRRHPELTLTETEGLTKSRAIVTEEYIRKWFRDLQVYLKEINAIDILKDPTRILNGDETSFALCPKTGKVLGPKGWKNFQKECEKDTLTVMLAFTANGELVSPMVVFPLSQPSKAIVDSIPSGWLLGQSEIGWMQSETFYEYITNGVHQWLNDKHVKKPVLLFVDGHKSHLTMDLWEFCNAQEIILYALPPNTTHILQPADISVFKPLKTFWKKTVKNWQSSSDNIKKVLTNTNFSTLLAEVLSNKSLPDAIKNGFLKCGLFPFNADAVDYSCCIQNRLESLNLPEDGIQITSAELATTVSVLKKLTFKLKDRDIDAEQIIFELTRIYREENVNGSIVTAADTDNSPEFGGCNENIEDDYQLQFHEFCLTQNAQDSDENNLSQQYIRKRRKIESYQQQQEDREIIENGTNELNSIKRESLNSYCHVKDNRTESVVNVINQQQKQDTEILENRKELNIRTRKCLNNNTEEEVNDNIINEINEPKYTSNEMNNNSNKVVSTREKQLSTIYSDKFTQYVSNKEEDKKTEEIKNRTEEIRPEKTDNENTKNTLIKRLLKSNKLAFEKQNKKRRCESNEACSVKIKQKCGECKEELDSDTEENHLKHVGCDKCSRWYHLMCTEFVGSTYEDIENEDFVCIFYRRPRICDQCGKVFNHTSHLRIHMYIHKGEKPYSCKECGKSFTQTGNLRRHERSHRGEKPFICSECNKGFTSTRQLKVHERIHTGEKPYVCELCGKSFSQFGNLQTHKKIHTGEKPFICNQCNKSFALKFSLEIHERTHTGEKPYACKQCGKFFTQMSALKTHEKIHTGEKPFVCKLCNKSFTLKFYLNIHERYHTGEKRHICKYCGKSFTQSNTLKTHENIHTGEKPYGCKQCGKSFNQSNTLRTHEKIHTNKKSK